MQEKDSVRLYTITYRELNRKLEITLEKKFPYQVLSWTDTFPGIDGKVLSTTATRNKTLRVDYWTKHQNADRHLREQLGLPPGMQ